MTKESNKYFFHQGFKCVCHMCGKTHVEPMVRTMKQMREIVCAMNWIVTSLPNCYCSERCQDRRRDNPCKDPWKPTLVHLGFSVHCATCEAFTIFDELSAKKDVAIALHERGWQMDASWRPSCSEQCKEILFRIPMEKAKEARRKAAEEFVYHPTGEEWWHGVLEDPDGIEVQVSNVMPEPRDLSVGFKYSKYEEKP